MTNHNVVKRLSEEWTKNGGISPRNFSRLTQSLLAITDGGFFEIKPWWPNKGAPENYLKCVMGDGLVTLLYEGLKVREVNFREGTCHKHHSREFDAMVKKIFVCYHVVKYKEQLMKDVDVTFMMKSNPYDITSLRGEIFNAIVIDCVSALEKRICTIECIPPHASGKLGEALVGFDQTVDGLTKCGKESTKTARGKSLFWRRLYGTVTALAFEKADCLRIMRVYMPVYHRTRLSDCYIKRLKTELLPDQSNKWNILIDSYILPKNLKCTAHTFSFNGDKQ